MAKTSRKKKLEKRDKNRKGHSLTGNTSIAIDPGKVPDGPEFIYELVCRGKIISRSKKREGKIKEIRDNLGMPAYIRRSRHHPLGKSKVSGDPYMMWHKNKLQAEQVKQED